jgi:mono/diheme cytochrome c family protein
MNQRTVFSFLLAVVAGLAVTSAQTKNDINRGELLYSTHCAACHSVQIHWRAKRLTTDWLSLKAEVRRWQGIAGLGWSDDEMEDVAWYLNAVYYQFVAPRLGRSPVGDTRKGRT